MDSGGWQELWRGLIVSTAQVGVFYWPKIKKYTKFGPFALQTRHDAISADRTAFPDKSRDSLSLWERGRVRASERSAQPSRESQW
jgi:hypothetical protein